MSAWCPIRGSSWVTSRRRWTATVAEGRHVPGFAPFLDIAPIMWVGPVEHWLAALERIVELEPLTVVPGHGPVTDLDGVRTMREYWELVAPAVRERLDAGMTPEAAAREIIAAPQYEQQPFGDWEGAERLVVSADTIARNDRGETGRVGEVAEIQLLAAMGRLANERRRT